MSIPVVVVGAGGFGREVCDVIEAVNAAGSIQIELLGVLDDSPSESNLQLLEKRGMNFLGSTEEFLTQNHGQGIAYFIGIGAPAIKRKIDEAFRAAGFTTIPLVHPDSTIGSRVKVAGGAVICAGARLTTNISVGSHVHININATVGHDVTIGDYVSVNPLAAVSGDVVLEAGVLIGASAFVMQGVNVGEGATVGASACVTSDVFAGTTVIGVPARQLNRNGVH